MVQKTNDPRETDSRITRLLIDWAGGDEMAGDALLRLVYDRLHQMARNAARGADSVAELQPTELVAEAWLKLDSSRLGHMHRQHFLALSARVMRQVLVDHARRALTEKRGGGWLHVTLSKAGADPTATPFEVLALDEGMTRLAEIHPRAASGIELHYFGGLTAAESAAHLQVTQRTVERDLRFGRAWLKEHLDAA